MTEAEWLSCSDPKPMLVFLCEKNCDRKLRLFACACVQRLACPRDISEEEYQVDQNLVELAEGYADGQVSKRKLRKVRSELGAMGGYSSGWAASNADSALLNDVAAIAAQSASAYSSSYISFVTLETGKGYITDQAAKSEAAAAANTELREHCGLLREIFGNPFRTIILSPALLTSTVMQLAEAIYADRAFDRLPLLADALEEAGCDNADILAHCRGPGPHVRGCWIVDLLTGRE